MCGFHRGRGYRWRWLVVAVMLVAEIMDLLDATVVNVSGPSLEKSLGSTPIGLQWVIGGYTLALGAGLILGGRLGDRFGRRRMFLVGIATFTLASLLCALAPTIEALIALRLVQGFTATMLLPQGFGLLRENLSGREFGAAFGIFGPVFGLGGIIGPILGGTLIEGDLFGLGWRSVFLVNLPIGIIAFVVAYRILPRRPGDSAITVDGLGALIVAAASVLLVVPSVFRKAAYSVGLGGFLIFFAGLVGTQLVLTLFLQVGQFFSAGEAGLGNLPLAVGSAIGGALSGAVLADRFGRTVLQFGPIVQFAGAALLWVELASTDSFTIWQIVPGLVLSGIGSGLVIAALFIVILGAVDDNETGSASGVLAAVQAIGGSVGVAVFGSVFFATITAGSAAEAYRAALLIHGGLLVVFIVLSFFYPKKGRPEGGEWDEPAEPAREAVSE